MFEIYKRNQGKHTRVGTFVGGMILAFVGGYWLSERLISFSAWVRLRFLLSRDANDPVNLYSPAESYLIMIKDYRYLIKKIVWTVLLAIMDLPIKETMKDIQIIREKTIIIKSLFEV